MGIREEIVQRYKGRTGRNVEPTKNMGFDAISKQVGKSARLTDPGHGELTPTMKRWLASEEDRKDPKNAYLYTDEITHCKICGKELTFSQISSGTRICTDCANKQAKEKTRAAIISEEQTKQTKVMSPFFASVPAAPVEAPVVHEKMLSEDEQKEFANSMCRISTFQDLVQHAPDRAIVMIHVENFSPTINNYYGEKNDK